ncbi:replication factor C large subunit [Halobacteria archaeon HArc-gm2]|nr:replication factor C large subunit [Halobacteria archaeon HArc-gm2]
MTDWTEKYRPSTLAEVRGNDKARDKLKEWADSWENHRKAVIVHGAPGIGKTSAAHALANDMGWPTIELNASDSRTKDVIERVAGEAAKSGTLTEGGAGRRLVVMDEADNIHGNADRGGSRAVTSLVKEAGQPMILIANEFYDMGNGLRNSCEDIEFRDVGKRSIVPVLRDILRQEDVTFDDDALTQIAEMNDGDLRGAVKDLQALADGKEHLAADDVVTSERDKSEGIFDYLDEVIKTAGAEEALKSSYDVDETPDDLINWIEDNMPKDYEGAELAKAYGFLANADRWLGRVRATQNYTFWKYAGDNMTAGVAASRDGKKSGWTRYGPPSYWSKLGRSKGTRNTRDHIAQQIAAVNGVSMRTARRDVMPFLATMTHHCKNRELTVAMAAQYDMEASHVSFVTGSGKDTNKVQSIVEDAEELKEAQAVEHSDGAFEGAMAGQTDAGEAGDGDETDDATGAADDEDADQVTLDDGAGDDEEAEDEDDDSIDSQEAEDDQSQSGLSDFM